MEAPRIASTLVFVLIFAYLNNFKEINMKNAYFSKKIIKNIKAGKQLGILCFSIGKKTYMGMPPFIGSSYIRKKRPALHTTL